MNTNVIKVFGRAFVLIRVHSWLNQCFPKPFPRLPFSGVPVTDTPARVTINRPFIMYKIIGADGKEYGPVSAEQLRDWMRQEAASPHKAPGANIASDKKRQAGVICMVDRS